MTRNDDSTAVLIAAAIPVLALFGFSRWIGADFELTVDAIVASAGVLLVAFAVWWFIRPDVLMLAVLSLVIVWPLWWPVLDSIAVGGEKPDFWLEPDASAPWWTAEWFRWAVEAALVGAFAYLASKKFT